MELIKKAAIIIALFAILLIAVDFYHSNPIYNYHSKELPYSFDEYYQNRLENSRGMSVRPGNEEKLIRFSSETPAAILYIHGFSASRAEGEEVINAIASEFRYNTYYLRLPGHGTTKEDMASVNFSDLLDESIDALMMMEMLGDRVILAGTSMGGLIATWLASNYPEKVSALILLSPFYDFTSPTGQMLFFHPAYKLITMLMPVRVSPASIPDEHDNWTKYWYPETYLSSTKLLTDLALLIDNKYYHQKISSPVLMLYYYKDEDNQDLAASVPDMLRVYENIISGPAAHPESKKAAIENGSHVLSSRYIKADHEAVKNEISQFIKGLSE